VRRQPIAVFRGEGFCGSATGPALTSDVALASCPRQNRANRPNFQKFRRFIASAPPYKQASDYFLTKINGGRAIKASSSYWIEFPNISQTLELDARLNEYLARVTIFRVSLLPRKAEKDVLVTGFVRLLVVGKYTTGLPTRKVAPVPCSRTREWWKLR